MRGMNVTSITPLVTTSQLARTRAFYVDLLGCEVSYDSDHYLGIRAGGAGSPELGFMHPDAMAPHAFAGEGLFFVLNVPSADREYGRLFAAGAELLGPPTDQPWGMRSFALRDPNGVMVIVAHAIPAAVEHQANFR